MAERPVEIELQAELRAWLDHEAGPYPRWASAPVASRIARLDARPRRAALRLSAAFAAAAAVVLAVLVAGQTGHTPAATPPLTAAPWPSAVPSDAAPTLGEVALGQVAISTSQGHPAVLVRVSPATDAPGGSTYRVEFRVVGAVGERFGSDRLVVVRNGVVTAERVGAQTGVADPLEILPGMAIGTERTLDVVVAAAANENVDLGFIGAGTAPAFWFPIRHVVIPSVAVHGCPTLADYPPASVGALSTPRPSALPIPSMEPAADGLHPSTGTLTLGQVGVMAAPDGTAGALVRVSDVRLCDRLPDVRPELFYRGLPGDYALLLADVDLQVLRDGTVDGFIPGEEPVWATWRSMQAVSPVPNRFPGGPWQTSVSTGPGWAVSGTMAWVVGSDRIDGRVAIEVGRQGEPQFEYLVRDGSTGLVQFSPPPTIAPGATPSTGTLPPDTTAVVARDGVLMPVWVGGVAVVDGYPNLMPSTGGDRFVEVVVRFGSPRATFIIDPKEWLVVGPGGRALAPAPIRQSDGSTLLPWIGSAPSSPVDIPPSIDLAYPMTVVAEIPPAGRITLEYRPHGGPAQVTWVVRDH